MRIEALMFAVAMALAGVAQAHSDATGFAGKDEHDHDGEAAVPGAIEVDSGLIRVAEVEQRELRDRRAGIGTVVTPANSTHDVNSFISGQVIEIHVRPGNRVNQGDPIALIQSPEFVLTQKAYVALLSNDEKRAILEGEGRLGNYMEDARENLRWWGLTEEEILGLEQTGIPLEGITVRAPSDGLITEVLVRPGELLNAGDRNMANFVVMGQAIARIVPDSRSLWLETLIFPDAAAGVRPGDARLQVQLPDGSVIEQAVEAVSPSLDPQRRLVRLMTKLDARAGLYPGHPLQVELLVPRWEEAWLPRSALMRQGFETVVFIEIEPGRYERRSVEPGAAAGDWIPVDGLQAGTRVVTHGKMALEGAYRLQRADVSTDDHHH
ncbi:efflux RND transporter periplasmic adaptor subunit [Thiohalobacter thiocyanaticus]|uniref:HlyD family efflux transporter periplasmic adaptor subunit n=1 Tax=Thiohalobacter thiocyanaticus TaxID=585455 RepID=A0A426QJ09_9GAMM|nr:efflux RND transporter periplasmic adaptor subunit [Thiohalobacter thiocyanaticus]RRQ21687.1 HlyD family efflux transporter periplasmic adaptor subunit [Thiohalobacter thiocyanaticus]